MLGAAHIFGRASDTTMRHRGTDIHYLCFFSPNALSRPVKPVLDALQTIGKSNLFAQVTAMQISGHKTDSMFRRYAIIAENDMRAALRMTQNHLATARKDLIATPGIVN